MYYIYKIENLLNHKKYIGLTNNIQRRRARHFTDLRGVIDMIILFCKKNLTEMENPIFLFQ